MAPLLFGVVGAFAAVILAIRPSIGAVVVAVVGLGLVVPLRRRMPWAIWTAAVVGPCGAAWFLVDVVQGADDDPGDASAYAAMGGLVYFVMAVLLSAGLLYELRRRKHPRSGWYADPDAKPFWRYWDGVEWTDHRAPR